MIPSACSSVTSCSHFKIAQNTIAVKKEEHAYTSPSTALYQKESEKQYAKAPTAPAAIIAKMLLLLSVPPFFKISFRAKWVIDQNKKSIVNPLAKALMVFTPTAALCASNGSVKILPINTKSGAPGG